MVGGGIIAGVVTAVGAMAAATVAAVVVVAISGAACTDAVVGALSMEDIAVAPPKFGHRSASV